MVKTKQDILTLFNAIDALGHLKGVKFTYGMAKNINILKPEVESLQEAAKGSDEFLAYEKSRGELLEKYAKKDEDNKSVIVNNEYVLEDQKGFDTEFNKLRKENKKVLDDRQTQIDEVDKLLKEETTIKLYKIKVDDIPEDITTKQMNSIFDLIEE